MTRLIPMIRIIRWEAGDVVEGEDRRAVEDHQGPGVDQADTAEDKEMVQGMEMRGAQASCMTSSRGFTISRRGPSS